MCPFPVNPPHWNFALGFETILFGVMLEAAGSNCGSIV